MRIKSVKIGSHFYRVVPVTTPDLDDSGRWAEIDRRRYEIRLQTWERPGPAMAESFLHEILHGLFNDAGRGGSEIDEENVVEILSPRLAAFMADNPETVRELLRMLK